MRFIIGLLAVAAWGQGIESTSFTVLPQTNSAGAPSFPGALTFRSASGGNNWPIFEGSINRLFFQNSGTPVLVLNASGSPTWGGSGFEIITPSIAAKATTTNTPGLVVQGVASAAADTFDVMSNLAVKQLWVDASGVTHIANCASCSGTGTAPIVVSGGAISCPTCLTTAGGQTITGPETFASNIQEQGALQFFNGSAGPQWQIISNSPNLLLFQDSSSVTRASLNAVQSGPNGILFSGPSAIFTATNTTTPTLLAIAAPSQTADIFDVTNPGGIIGTKYLWVDSTGATHIANCVAGCGGASVTSPITLIGGAIGCASCITTAGGQTIGGSLIATLFNASAAGASIAFQAGSGNFQVDGNGDVSGAGAFNTATNYTVQNVLGGQTLATLQGRLLDLPGIVGTDAVRLEGSGTIGGRMRVFDNAGQVRLDEGQNGIQFINGSGANQVKIEAVASGIAGSWPLAINSTGITLTINGAGGIAVANSGTSVSNVAATFSGAGAGTAVVGITHSGTAHDLIIGPLGSSVFVDGGTGAKSGACTTGPQLFIRSDGTTAGSIGYYCPSSSSTWIAVF